MRPHALHPGAIQGKEGIKFCHLATLIQGDKAEPLPRDGGLGGDEAGPEQRGRGESDEAADPVEHRRRAPEGGRQDEEVRQLRRLVQQDFVSSRHLNLQGMMLFRIVMARSDHFNLGFNILPS